MQVPTPASFDRARSQEESEVLETRGQLARSEPTVWRRLWEASEEFVAPSRTKGHTAANGTVKDNEEKLSDDVKTEVQADIDAVKTALEGDDDSAVESAVEKLQGSMGKIGEAVYAQQDAGAEGTDGDAAGAAQDDEDIVDAEVVDDEDGKNGRK